MRSKPRQTAYGLPYPVPSGAAATTRMRANRRSDTGPELRLRSALHGMGLRFRKDYPIELEGRQTRVDIAFPSRRLAIFVDGCFWHQCPEHGTMPKSNPSYWKPKLARNVARDRRVTTALEAAGWKVVRVWEHVPPEDAANLVLATLADRGQRP
jgi:DNA mismatch endonuclease, patch repair protein